MYICICVSLTLLMLGKNFSKKLNSEETCTRIVKDIVKKWFAPLKSAPLKGAPLKGETVVGIVWNFERNCWIFNWNCDEIDVIQKKITKMESYWNCYDNWRKFWVYFRISIKNECNLMICE